MVRGKVVELNRRKQAWLKFIFHPPLTLTMDMDGDIDNFDGAEDDFESAGFEKPSNSTNLSPSRSMQVVGGLPLKLAT